MLRMTIEGVGFDHLKQTIVVLKDWESRKLLPIWIGAAEARSIALHLELEGAKPPRPMAHDLLMECIQFSGGHVARVVINDLQDSTFYATIDINTPTGTIYVDSRPSDAIALAVRAKCPVFVDGGALAALVDVTEETVHDATSGENATRETSNLQTPDEEIFPLDNEDYNDADSAQTDFSTLDSPTEQKRPSNAASTPVRPADDDLDRFRRLVGDLDL